MVSHFCDVGLILWVYYKGRIITK